MRSSKNTEKKGRTAVHLFFDDELLEKIEDFRFRFRHATRTGAIRDLIMRGLEAAKHPAADKRDRKKT